MRLALALIAALACASATAQPRNMNIGGQGGHLNVPLSQIAARYLPTISTADECTCAAIPGVTVSRSSSATCTKSDGTLVTCDADEPRVEADGVLVEVGATNYFLNSGSPATQTLTLATGTYTGWIDRTGSETMALAVGTATATGLPCTAGASDCTFTVTTAGTVSATVTGTPTRAQVENSSVRTSYIATAGTQAARVADNVSVSTAGWPVAAGSVALDYTPQWASAADDNSGRLISVRDASNGWEMYVQTNATIAFGTPSSVSASSVLSWSQGTTYRLRATWGDGNRNIYRDGTSVKADTGKTDPASIPATAYIGRYAPSATFYGIGWYKNLCVGRTQGACQ